jgi:MFS superfamily sulfate permease-like transporter
VPQDIAYSSNSGGPAHYGLYAALGSLLGSALFGTPGIERYVQQSRMRKKTFEREKD